MSRGYGSTWRVNTLRPRQNGRRFADDTFKRIFLDENIRISIKISLKFVPKGPINNNPALVQIMAWRRPGDKPLSETMMVKLLTHICVTRPQWVNDGWLCVGLCWSVILVGITGWYLWQTARTGVAGLIPSVNPVFVKLGTPSLNIDCALI